MHTLNIQPSDDGFILHFGGDFERINAYTLATSLINLADAAKTANNTINPGYEIEVVVESLGSGSFKAKIAAIYTKAGNLFSTNDLRAIVLGLISAFIYEHTLAPSPDITVQVNTSEVVIEQDDRRVVIPREVHEALGEAKKSEKFKASVGGLARSLTGDPTIKNVAMYPAGEDTGDDEPPLSIPRKFFATLDEKLPEPSTPRAGEVSEIAELRILRAILERSRRRWQFAWRGMKISAPVTDDKFYDDFIAHRITIAPGDILKVRLLIKRELDPASGIFINKSYEVVDVIDHVPRSNQAEIVD